MLSLKNNKTGALAACATDLQLLLQHHDVTCWSEALYEP